LLADHLPVERIEDLAVPFQCVAASIERAAEHWFTEGSLSDAVMASCAVPGLLAPVRIGDEHYLDGGLVNSIPVSRAVELGAATVFVLQVGRVE
ncbi:MAG: patatin-like phospholipase family protein, partial [Actinomycetes bacterium]